MITVAAVLVAAVIGLIIYSAGRSPRLLLSDQLSGRVYARYKVQYGEEFSVTFRHSVNKSDVTEIYELREDGIWLTGCDYYGFGAGVAEVLEPGWTLETTPDGLMQIRNINMKMNDLTYIVGTVYDHIMQLHGEDIVLNELCGRNSKVHFTLK